MRQIIRDTGFRSLGSLVVLSCLGLWHIGGVFVIVGGFPPNVIGDVGQFLCSVAFIATLALIPGTLIWSSVRRFRALYPFDYHGPMLAVFSSVIMGAEAILVLAGLGIG